VIEVEIKGAFVKNDSKKKIIIIQSKQDPEVILITDFSSRYESKRRIEDDVSKKISDIRMSPWSEGQELGEAQAASARAR
jgi:hypothetical protein